MITMTKQEWEAKGKALFGEERMQWRFVCPGCGHIQTAEDFRIYKDKGATPNSVTCECIGRYAGGKSWANESSKKPGPCDYAGYGLLNICPVAVVDGGKTIYSFNFSN